MKKTTLSVILCLTGLFGIKQSQAQMFVTDTVPLIIHVVHNGEAVGSGRNLSPAQIMSQFPILNADFAGQGWNVGNVPSVWASLVANTGIVFVPAMVDTNGVPLAEPGIDRIDRNVTGWMNTMSMNSTAMQNYVDATIKPQSIWDHNSYCNVWLIDMSASGMLGYSTFPANSGLPWLVSAPTATATNDGVCVHYKCWGDTLNVIAPFDHGRTATHEFGHWLGLRHMMGGCVAQDVADVPIAQYNFWMTSPVFPHSADTCAGYPDGPMFMNFMCNTVSDSDIYMFTSGQASAMRQGLTNGHGSVISSGVWHPVSIKQAGSAETGLIVYPNPSTGEISVHTTAAHANVSLAVFNTLGEKVYSQEISSWTGMHSVSLSQQPGGIYLVSFTSEGKTSIQKVIIH